jgi:outer membrane protein assembly factor BamD (BamD/ComL family)
MTRLFALFGIAITLAATGCRSEPVDPQELLTANHLGLGDLRKGQLAQAEEQFKKVVALAPQDPLGHANLGLTYLRGERYEEAERELRRAQRLSPENPDVGLIVARLYSLTNREAEARKTLEQLRRDPRVFYALAELDARDSSAAGVARYEQRLREVLSAAPANLAVRLKLVDVLVRRGVADSAARHLEEIRRLRPEPPLEARPALDTIIQRLNAGQVAEARAPLDRFLRLMELTSPYQGSLEEVKWLEGPIVGRPVLAFNPQSLISTRGIGLVGRTADVRFTDITADAGFPAAGVPTAMAAVAVGDYDGDGSDDVVVSLTATDGRAAVSRLYHVRGGYVADNSERAGVAPLLPAGATFATFADVDNDGWLDLFAIGADGKGYLLRNNGQGSFENVASRARLVDITGARKAVFLDSDHDGDLDLLLPGNPTRLFRNNLDGTFTDITASSGLRTEASRDAAIGDLDDDGRIDLVVAHAGGDALYRNAGFQRFVDVTAASSVTSTTGSAAVQVVDYDNDGRLDVLLAGSAGDNALWRNTGTAFTRDRRSDAVLQRLGRVGLVAIEPLDYDNDGWLDLAAVGTRGAALLRNNGGRYEDRTSMLPGTPRSIFSLVPSDVEGDGDQDLFIADASGPHLLRNDGGNARMAMQVQLVGLRTGSGKNNTFGTGSRIEVRAGEVFQTRVVTRRITHFGLGSHLKADVIRVQWTNGVPEMIYFPGTDEDILELEQLKGSCAFLYTWDGKGFRFVTDVMWRSALGMPLGIMGGGAATRTAYAPAGASQEYLRIPGDALQPRDGRYVLQFTEELWETAYLDEIKLLAVDHPDSVEVFVDERFVPPGPVTLRPFPAIQRRPPRSATDERGNDLLPAVRAQDDRYVSNFTPLQYQGLVKPHDLILDLGDEAGQKGTRLYLRGWIYPTDASINVALGQQSAVSASMPSLEVRNARGQWQVAVPTIGFPSGKDKTIVIDLAGMFPTSDHHVRIRTNMHISWDHVFVATDAPESVTRTSQLKPVSADLHFRGYSRMYRKGGPQGPHWFAYQDVSKDSPWRPITGAFTRFGDVLPLLGGADDMYVVMAPGDEATVQFDATAAPALPSGWKRTFLLYTDGWIKDADLNTAFGNSVEPLPFHAIRSYPYAAGESYPTDSARQRYRREYNTRVIGQR